MTCCTTTDTLTRADAPATGAPHTVSYRPAVDIVERADSFALLLDMPGCTAQTIDVSVTGNELTITGTVRPRTVPAGETAMLREYGIGDFARTIRVGEGIDLANVGAEYRHGVLTLTLPKATQTRTRRIRVASN